MEKPRRILLYGKSVILDTLEESLKPFPQMEIIVLSAPFPTTEELKAMTPDVIIFDTASRARKPPSLCSKPIPAC